MANPVASFYRLIPRRVKPDRLLDQITKSVTSVVANASEYFIHLKVILHFRGTVGLP